MSATSPIKLATISLILVLSFVAVSRAHHHPAYYHESGTRTSNPNWMSVIEDDTLLSELSIPGTHQTMARFGGPVAECQKMSLEDQLLSGIRVLDIRCRHVGQLFNIHHGPVYQNATFDDVLFIVMRFLKDHPGETVFMRVKEEHDPADTSRTFEETFRERYWNICPAFFWQPTSNNPRLGDLRGKIVILQDFAREGEAKYGIRYLSFDIQDEHKVLNLSDLYGKWLFVKNYLSKADVVRSDTRETRYINYLSAAGFKPAFPFPFPWFVASGHGLPATSADRLWTGYRALGSERDRWPDFPRAALDHILYEGTNVLTDDRLCRTYRRRVGILMADYPGPGLIDRTIRLNDRLRKEGWRVPWSEGCSEWERPGSGTFATDIGIGADGSVWAIGRQFEILQWNEKDRRWGFNPPRGYGWRIDVAPDGVPWVVNTRREILRLKEGRWERLPGAARDIGIGADGSVWVVGTRSKTGGFEILKWTGSQWQATDGAGLRIDVDPQGEPWIVNSSEQIWRRVKDEWVRLPGLAHDIGIGADGTVWVIGNRTVAGENFAIFKLSRGQWQVVPGGGRDISVDPQGLPWVSNVAREIWRNTYRRP